MCLSIPGKIVSISSEMAKVSVGGSLIDVNIQLIENPAVDDYVLVHSGFAIQKIDEQEAKETLQMFKELDEINKDILPLQD